MSTSVREARLRRHRRVRGKVSGTADRPRLVVFRSNKGIFAQLVDDEAGRTLASASWLGQRSFKGTKTEQAAAVGKALAAEAKRPASRRASSTGAAICTTDASRRSPTARAREDSSFEQHSRA